MLTHKAKIVILGQDSKIEKAKAVSILDLFPNKENLRPLGDKYMGICPIHQEKVPSFAFYPKTNSFYCFACGKSGDSITFLMEIYKINFKEAVERLVP